MLFCAWIFSKIVFMRGSISICIPVATGDTTLCSCLSQQTLNRPPRVILPRVSCALPDLLPVGITDSAELTAWVRVVCSPFRWWSADFWFLFFGWHWLALLRFVKMPRPHARPGGGRCLNHPALTMPPDAAKSRQAILCARSSRTS
jgi:hypothetical protein